MVKPRITQIPVFFRAIQFISYVVIKETYVLMQKVFDLSFLPMVTLLHTLLTDCTEASFLGFLP